MTIKYASQASVFLRWHGTVLPITWKLMALTGLLSCFVTYVYDQHQKAVKRGSVSFTYYLFHDSEKFFGIATTFVTFILGFFIVIVFARWWKLRDLCGVVVSRAQDTAMFMVETLQGPLREQDRKASSLKQDRALVQAAQEDIREIARYTALVEALFFMTVRGDEMKEGLLKLCDMSCGSLPDRMLLEKGSEEHQALLRCDCNRHEVVCGWLLRRHKQNIAKRVKDGGKLHYILYTTNAHLWDLRAAAAAALMHRDTPIPIGYTHLLDVFVKIYVFTAPVALAPLLLWSAPPVVMVLTFFLDGFLNLGRMMLNPFKDEDDSFETSSYLKDSITAISQSVQDGPKSKRP